MKALKVLLVKNYINNYNPKNGEFGYYRYQIYKELWIELINSLDSVNVVDVLNVEIPMPAILPKSVSLVNEKIKNIIKNKDIDLVILLGSAGYNYIILGISGLKNDYKKTPIAMIDPIFDLIALSKIKYKTFSGIFKTELNKIYKKLFLQYIKNNSSNIIFTEDIIVTEYSSISFESNNIKSILDLTGTKIPTFIKGVKTYSTKDGLNKERKNFAIFFDNNTHQIDSKKCIFDDSYIDEYTNEIESIQLNRIIGILANSIGNVYQIGIKNKILGIPEISKSKLDYILRTIVDKNYNEDDEE